MEKDINNSGYESIRQDYEDRSAQVSAEMWWNNLYAA